MKNKIGLMTVFRFIIILSSLPAYAHNMGIKLKRGVVNVITAPLEIPKQTSIYWKKGAEKTNNLVPWAFAGFIKGMVNMVGRMGSGLWDITTFNIEVPADYEPLMKPDYVCDKSNNSVSSQVEK